MVYLKLLAAALFWGGTFVAARIVSQEVGPYSASFLRFLVASLLLLAAVYLKEGRLPALTRRQFLPAFLLGMTGVFSYNVFFFLGMKDVSAGRASLIVATNPAFIALTAAFIFKERLTVMKTAGIGLCLAGAAVVVSRGDAAAILAGGMGRGELFIFGCVASWVAYSLIGKALLKELSPLAAVTYSCLLGDAALLPTALWEGLGCLVGRITLVHWLSLAYLGLFGTALGFLWYYEGIKAIGPARASVFINFVPVSGVALGWLILGEAVNLSLLLGALLVVAGVTLTNRTN